MAPPLEIGGAGKTISFGIVEGRAVFVDEQADTYFMLSPEEETEFLAGMRAGPPANGTTQPIGAAVIPGPAEIVEARAVPPNQELVAPAGKPGNRISDLLRTWSLVRRTRRDLDQRPIATLLSDLRGDGSSLEPPTDNWGNQSQADDGAEIAATIARFVTARRLVPVAPNCLLDSVSLARWLDGSAFAGLALVFGAKLNPFAAHCWLQAGPLLINDRLEHIARFTPVRVVPCSRATL